MPSVRSKTTSLCLASSGFNEDVNAFDELDIVHERERRRSGISTTAQCSTSPTAKSGAEMTAKSSAGDSQSGSTTQLRAAMFDPQHDFEHSSKMQNATVRHSSSQQQSLLAQAQAVNGP